MVSVDIAALRSIEREKEISFETILQALETALLSAYRHTNHPMPHARVEIDRKSGVVTVWAAEYDPDGNLIIWAPSKPISKPAAPVADKPVALKAPASSMPQTGDEFYIEFPLVVLAGALLFALLAQKRRQSGEVEHA